MLEKSGRSALSGVMDHDRAPIMIRRVDAIPVALPLKTPMKMSAETVTAAQNLLVRIEAADGKPLATADNDKQSPAVAQR